MLLQTRAARLNIVVCFLLRQKIKQPIILLNVVPIPCGRQQHAPYLMRGRGINPISAKLMFRNFKLLFLPLDFVVSSVERWGRLGGGERTVETPRRDVSTLPPPFVPPIKGGIIFNSCSRRSANLFLLFFYQVWIVLLIFMRIPISNKDKKTS